MKTGNPLRTVMPLTETVTKWLSFFEESFKKKQHPSNKCSVSSKRFPERLRSGSLLTKNKRLCRYETKRRQKYLKQSKTQGTKLKKQDKASENENNNWKQKQDSSIHFLHRILQVSSLQTELEEVQSFRDRQKEIEDVLFTFQQDKKKLEEEFELERTKLEKNFFEETSRLRREFEHQLTQQKRIAETEQEQYLDDRVKDILKQNRRLAVELSLHKQVLCFAPFLHSTTPRRHWSCIVS